MDLCTPWAGCSFSHFIPALMGGFGVYLLSAGWQLIFNYVGRQFDKKRREHEPTTMQVDSTGKLGQEIAEIFDDAQSKAMRITTGYVATALIGAFIILVIVFSVDGDTKVGTFFGWVLLLLTFGGWILVPLCMRDVRQKLASAGASATDRTNTEAGKSQKPEVIESKLRNATDGASLPRT